MPPIGQSSEDYLETIYAIEQSNGSVKSIDIARRQNVSRPSVNKAINNLKKLGLVTQQSYGDIYLTTLGRQKALEVAHKHTVLTHFLTDILHVSSDIAQSDACKIEHNLSNETFSKLEAFLSKYSETNSVDS